MSSNDRGAKWFILSGMTFLIGTTLALASQSINPFIYTLAPSQLCLLVGLSQTKDVKALSNLIKGVVFSILFSGTAFGSLYFPMTSPPLTYLLVGASLLTVAGFTYSTCKENALN